LLGTLLYFLSQVRNKCAHNERIYDSTIITKLPKNSYHDHFGINKRDNFFAILVALKFFMTTEEFNRLILYVDDNFQVLLNDVPSQYTPIILGRMGMPTKWQ